jgi:hypothetical protein
MIEKYYAMHIKTSLNAAAINVVRSNKDWLKKRRERQTVLRADQNRDSPIAFCLTAAAL